MWKICKDFLKYEITSYGDIRHKGTKHLVRQVVDRSGYLTCRLYSDSGTQTTVYVHRLVMKTFRPNNDVSKNVVNHKNGIKTDSRLQNLEWVTTIENIHHAGKHHLTPKCKPAEIRNVTTGKIYKFPSSIDCSRFLNESKDVTLFRLNSSKGDEVGWSNGYQYRWCDDSGRGWKRPTTENSIGKSIHIQIRIVDQNKILTFSSQKDAASYLKKSSAWISGKLRKDETVVYEGRYQIRYQSTSKWKQQ